MAATAPERLSSALAAFDRFAAAVGQRRPAVFLDYDGTLTPIVDRPEQAVLDPALRETLATLAARYPVAVISGRDLDDVRRLVGLDGLVYAGSHGFDMVGPMGARQVGTESLPDLDRAESVLRRRLSDVPGLRVERKRFAIAVHTRQAAPEQKAEAAAVVAAVAGTFPDLRRTGGKEVVELRPNLDWDKGRAVMAVMAALGLDSESSVPIYIGDDVTDEDALRAVRDRGIGILVTDAPSPATLARFTLANPGEVRAFLEALAQ